MDKKTMKHTVAAHLKHTDKLHLGCGGLAPPGWINTDGSWHVWLAKRPLLKKLALLLGLLPRIHGDHPWPASILQLNLRKPLPFPDNTLSAVYASHVLEHLYRDEALALLKETHRCCRTGGVVRMAVPDLARYITDYQQGMTLPEAPGHTPGDTLLYRFHLRTSQAPGHTSLVQTLYHTLLDFNSHKWLYDQHSLIALFREAGFLNPKKRAVLESHIQEIDGIERPDHIVGGNTVIIEARKEATP